MKLAHHYFSLEQKTDMISIYMTEMIWPTPTITVCNFLFHVMRMMRIITVSGPDLELKRETKTLK